MMERIFEEFRKEAEKCDFLQGVIIYRATSGGTGSGLGDLVTERLCSNYLSTKKLFQASVVPSPTTGSIIVDSYNHVLSVPSMIEHCTSEFLFDNEAIYRYIANNLQIEEPSLTDVNQLIAKTMAGVTYNMRFGGMMN